ncbi:MAG: hypothetical protein U0414_43860 [Polyangiaceae bacterium]
MIASFSHPGHDAIAGPTESRFPIGQIVTSFISPFEPRWIPFQSSAPV